MMKSLSLTPTTAAVLAALATVAVVSADSKFPVVKPDVRYTPFSRLDTTTQTIAEEKLGYDELTWNNHGLASIEKRRWTSLTSNERDGADLLGFSQERWDCFINHFVDYAWDELAEIGNTICHTHECHRDKTYIQQHYEQLGWTQAHWEGTTTDVPYTEARWWGQLTGPEQEAANGLCFFETNWDRVDMNPNPSFFPHPMPSFRYTPWHELDSVTHHVAESKLGYTHHTWDHLRTSLVERNTFFNLEPEEREGAMDLGFYMHTWDCFMNHYSAYYWSSFHEDLKVAIETLGWTEDMWAHDSETVPASETTKWAALTPDERAAATRLCFFEESWDDLPVGEFYDYDAGRSAAGAGDAGQVPQDINLDIFEHTGYAGKAPESVGLPAYTVLGRSGSCRTLAPSGVAALVLSVGLLLWV